jgi:hypothetical protein
VLRLSTPIPHAEEATVIIDCHVHAGILGKHYPRWWIEELYRPWGGLPTWDPSLASLSVGQRLLNQMNETKVDKMCIMTSDHRRVYLDRQGPYTPNEFLLEVRAEAPDRFVCTAGLDPMRDPFQAVNEMEQCVRQWDFRAIKIYPSYDHFDPGDERLFPLYQKATQMDIPVQAHMGWTPCINALMKFQHPHLFDAVGIRFPHLKVVICHLGWPFVDECMAVIAKHDNFHADLAYWAWFDAEEVLRTILKFGRLCGYDRLLYGSENSHTMVAPDLMRGLNDLAAKRDLPRIPEADLEKLLWRNTARLWKIKV